MGSWGKFFTLDGQHDESWRQLAQDSAELYSLLQAKAMARAGGQVVGNWHPVRFDPVDRIACRVTFGWQSCLLRWDIGRYQAGVCCVHYNDQLRTLPGG
jgi:hypothetical protein